MGLDSDWLNGHPEYFYSQGGIAHRSHAFRQRTRKAASRIFRSPDPFLSAGPSPGPENDSRRLWERSLFLSLDRHRPSWIMPSQCCAEKMTEVLCDLARQVDGVRCDMAMLVLREQVKIHRHPDMSWEAFNRLMPEEVLAGSHPVRQASQPPLHFHGGDVLVDGRIPAAAGVRLHLQQAALRGDLQRFS